MKIIFVRHGVPEEGDWMRQHGKGDFDRPLTAAGALEMRVVAAGLKAVIPSIDVLVASPLVRAQQTAAILAEAYLISVIHTEDALESGAAPTETLKAVMSYTDKTILCVGHQPNISSTISLALTGLTKPMIEMGRGAACGIEMRGGARPGEGMLLFHIPRRTFLNQAN